MAHEPDTPIDASIPAADTEAGQAALQAFEDAVAEAKAKIAPPPPPAAEAGSSSSSGAAPGGRRSGRGTAGGEVSLEANISLLEEL